MAPETRRALLWAVGGAMLVFVVVVNLFIAVSTLADRVASRQEREQILHLVEQIDSCVEPEGECARRGQERTAAVVQQLIDAIESEDLIPDPALRQAVLELCDAHGLDCADLRAPTEGN